MGKLCPYCGIRSAIVKNVTVDGNGATKASQVIAQVLACGHTVGGETYDKFVVECHEIDVKHKLETERAEQKSNNKKAALWKAMSEEMEATEDATE